MVRMANTLYSLSALMFSEGASSGFPTWDILRLYWPGTRPVEAAGILLVYILVASAARMIPFLRCRIRLLTVGLFVVLAVGTVGLGNFCICVLFFLSSLAVGRPFCPVETSPESDRLSWIVSTTIGSVLWGFAAWVLLHFRINYPSTYGVILALVLWAGRRAIACHVHRFLVWVLEPGEKIPVFTFEVAALAIFCTAITCLAGLFPETLHDALAQHLRLINYSRFNGYWDFSPETAGFLLSPNYFENFIYIVPAILGNAEDAAKLAHIIFFLLVVITMWNLIEERLGSISAWLAVAILASSPSVAQVVGSLFAEVSLMLSVLVACVVLARFPKRVGLLGIVGLGIVVAFPTLIKINGLAISAVIGLSIFLLLLGHRSFFSAVLTSACVAAVALIAVSLPMIQAYASTGNPLFPFYNTVFQSPYANSAEDFVDLRWVGHFSWDLLYQMTVNAPRFCEIGPGGFGFHYLFLVPLALVGIFTCRRVWFYFGIVMTALYCTEILLNWQYIRYLTPVLPLVVGLGLAGGQTLLPWRGAKSGAVLGLVALCFCNLVVFPSGVGHLRDLSLRTAFTPSARSAMVAQKAPIRIMGQFIAQTVGSRARVAFFGGTAGCDIPGRVFYDSEVYDFPYYSETHRWKTPEDAVRFFQREGITHCVVRHSRIDKHPNKDLILRVLSQYGGVQHSLGDWTVYKMDPVKLMLGPSKQGRF